MNGNTLYVDVKKGDETTIYEFDVVRESTLTSLSVASADGEEVLHPGFDKNVTDYTVSVTDNNDSVKNKCSSISGKCSSFCQRYRSDRRNISSSERR